LCSIPVAPLQSNRFHFHAPQAPSAWPGGLLDCCDVFALINWVSFVTFLGDGIVIAAVAAQLGMGVR